MDKEIQNSLPMLESKFYSKKKSYNYSNKSTQIAEGLVINTDEINKIKVGKTTTWTFRIENNYFESSDFENFMVKIFAIFYLK